MLNNIDIDEMVVSNKFPFGKQDSKYFIGYKKSKEITPLCIFFPYFFLSDKTRCMYFMIRDETFLDKCMIIWEKVSNMMKKLIVKLNMIKNI